MKYVGRMPSDRPASGEELNDSGEATTPRQAATVILLRGGARTLEVLLVQRNPQQRFMGGAWVFPGGAVDAHEAGPDGHRLAGVREVREESGVELAGPDALIPYSRWITPAEIKIRFDTLFFLAQAPADAAPVIDGSECVDWGWFTPAAALAAREAGELELVFPTMKTLDGLQRFDSADALLAWADGREVQPIEPRVVTDGEVAHVVLPGEPGYDN